MIEVKINKESFAYDVHSLIKAFYPEEEVNVREKETFTEEAASQMSVRVGDKEIEFVIYENQALQKKSRVCVENRERKLIKNQLKQLIYGALSDYTGRTLPWGTLTGIRPVKIPMSMLEQGKSNLEIADYMRQTYFCSNEKTALAISIANKEQEGLKGWIMRMVTAFM